MTYYRGALFLKVVPSVFCRAESVSFTFIRLSSDNPKKFTDGPIDPEVNFHSSLSENWWDMKTVAPLHNLNEVRVPFIASGIRQVMPQNTTTSPAKISLEDIDILDVGCGGGILSEALARLKANVTGLDPSPDLISIARKHAEKDLLLQYCLRYEVASIHNYCIKNAERFDAVVISEVIEHIMNKEKFIQDCLACLKPGGSIFFTTPNKTLLSKILVIHLAENIGIIPIGTHDYKKFITPELLSTVLKAYNCSIKRVEGISFNPFTGKFAFSSFKILMYGLHAQKNY